MKNVVSSLPTGNVTFLLTDIEGSTRAWQASPEHMTASVSRHYEILDAAIAAHLGQRPEEQGEGDSVVAVFRTAADAVAAALEAQIALRRELPALPVRMALHTGDAMLRNENNYVGLTIIRCARIRSCGHGGQILLSDDTATALRDTLPGGAVLSDLGVYGLRDLTGRERIWQLTHAELPRSFPPLKAGASAAGNLPTPISAFVGRTNELAALSHSLAEHRLVTITGDVGMGKSRLANAAAGAAADSMPGGVWWVPLAEVADDDAAAVAAAIAQACSLARKDGADPLDAVFAHFRSVAAALLVVDGCEYAPAGSAAAVARVLAQCPSVTIVATARERLNIAGEVIHPLSPLAAPPEGFAGGRDALDAFDAARLFVERAANASPDTGFDDAAAVVIARICRYIGGVPLGLELAAARTASTSLAELENSLATLAGGLGRGVGGLDSSLGTSIAWSYQLLSDDEQAALRRLSVFVGSIGIEAATAVVTAADLDERRAVTAIRGLLDHRMLSLDEPTGRFSMPRSIRRFAHERLVASTGLAGTTTRHGAWFAAVAEKFGAAGPSLPVSLLAPDEADVLAALDSSMQGEEPSVAYRIIIGLGAHWPMLDHADVVDTAASWIATRSPSDGEGQWAAAVARLGFVLAAEPDAGIHKFADEACAVAEFVHDRVSPLYLAFAEMRRAGTAAGFETLAASARQEGADELATAITAFLAAQSDGSEKPRKTAYA